MEELGDDTGGHERDGFGDRRAAAVGDRPLNCDSNRGRELGAFKTLHSSPF